MIIQAAVTLEKGAEFKIQDVELDKPKFGEVLVRIAATGICHTDIKTRNVYKPFPLPAVLGHEGAGVVEEVGDGVTSVKPGDHVVLSFSSCGDCTPCNTGQAYLCDRSEELNFSGKMKDGSCRHHLNGQPISGFFGQSSFATYSVVAERNLVKVDNDLPIELLGPLGCGIQTGSGAVLNRLKPEIGSTIAIFGCGTVGLSAVMAAKVAQCSKIICVDVQDSRLQLAEELGATHTINAKTADPVQRILEIANGGVNYSFDTSANPNVLRQAVDCLASLGTAAFVGGPPAGTEVKLNMSSLLFGRTVTGVIQGYSVPKSFIPQLISLYKSGNFPFDKLITYYQFEDINRAVHDMETGKTIKPVILISK